MPAPTLITDLSQTAASNSPSGSEAPSVLDDVQRAHAAFIAQLRDGKGHTNAVVLASAATCDIGGQNAMFVDVSGTTTITSFGTTYNGPRFVRFQGVLTLTNGASLSLPGGANITTAANDWCIAIPNPSGTGWVVSFYQRAASAPNPAASGANNDITSLTGLTGAVSGPTSLTGATAGMSLSNVASLNGGALGMLRNRVINGCFRIDQRKEGAALTLTAGAALAYCVDRFYAYCTGANATVQRVAGTGSRLNHLQFTGAASVTAIGLGHRIEGANVNDLNGTTATLSVVLANSLLTTVNWAVYYSNASDAFGTLAVPTRTLITSGSFTVNSTMTKYSANVAVPAGAAGRGIEIVLSVCAQTSGTWTVGDVVFETGSVATTYPVRPIALELDLCQRYYSKSYDIGTAPATATSAGAEAQRALGSALMQSAVKFKATMRATPTVTIYSTVSPSASTFRDATAAANGTVSAVNGVGQSGYTGFSASVAMTSTNAIEWHYTADAEL